MLALALALALAGAEPEPQRLERIQVTATRTARSAFDVPAAIGVVAGEDFRTDTPDIGISEKLGPIPGVLARDRQNLAQDEQVSIRGFGARSTFGIRGVRLYVDGLPASLPDGLGQVSQIDLAAAERVEVLRGPYSALYGNASGGVIQVFTAPGREPDAVAASGALGSYELRRANGELSGTSGALAWRGELSRILREGYREHSAAQRTLGSVRLDWQAGERTTLTLLGNAFDGPHAEDPLGLTRAQARADPSQASPAALVFDTRKSTSQQQVGAILEHRPSDSNALRVLAYAGERDVEQFLAIPLATQANPLHGGGVVDLHNAFDGLDARWTHQGTMAGSPLELVAGLTADGLDQHRRGYENFAGAMLGVRGALRRDQRDSVDDFDQYVQATWRPSEAWSLGAGVRHSRVRFESRDRYVTAQNPDDSGEAEYEATTPVASVLFRATSALNLYLAYGHAFETPTLDELGYRPDGTSGLNFALDPARSRNAELGAKWRSDSGVEAELTLFRADTRDELAIATSSGGRTTFQNAGDARRDGAELALDAPLAAHWRLRFAYTFLDARYRDDFLTCTTTPCPAPSEPVAAGTKLPGVPAAQAWGELRWDDESGWHASLHAQALDAVRVNTVGDERAPGYALLGLSGGYRHAFERLELRAFAALENLLDRRTIGSVIVNESNRRYYEPAPGRNLAAGLELRW